MGKTKIAKKIITLGRENSVKAMTKAELDAYDFIIVTFSGGKDSMASLLALLELDVDRSKVELWHHDIDGREGSTLMDWASTRAYCQLVADAFGLKIYYSWRVGGFEREMLRNDSLTAPVKFETPLGLCDNLETRRTQDKYKNTRELFPQVSRDLSVRWCSAYLKIDVCKIAINNQSRFVGAKTLVISGERAGEASNNPKATEVSETGRASYAEFEADPTDNRNGKKVKRHVDRWRPVHRWTETEVWAIIEKHRVRPNSVYRLGFSRVSCATCIFASPNQWATIKAINPAQFDRVSAFEKQFGKTIKRGVSVETQADTGIAYPSDPETEAEATGRGPLKSVILDDDEIWTLPLGAFGEGGCGPS